MYLLRRSIAKIRTTNIWCVAVTFALATLIEAASVCAQVNDKTVTGEIPAAGSGSERFPAGALVAPLRAPLSGASNDGPSAAASLAKGQAADDSKQSVWQRPDVWIPLAVLIGGITLVLGAIIIGKVNAFLAMISVAILVSLCAPGEVPDKVARVARSFGGLCGDIGLVIAMAAIVGKCMLDSGAADRIVRAFIRLLGERRAPWALMASGFILAIPVFFDTVFYLLVPLARSLYRRTRVQYVKYLMAIVAGGAITHTLVPPTPGPLLMASTLDVDLGMMILVGALVALPAAVVGVFYAALVDWKMPIAMRPLGSEPEPEPLRDDQLPPLWLSLAPVLLPVAMISLNTICTTIADMEPVAHIQEQQVRSWAGLKQLLLQENQVAVHLRQLLQSSAKELAELSDLDQSKEKQRLFLEAMNRMLSERTFYVEQVWSSVQLRPETRRLAMADRTRMRKAELEHFHRLLLEDAFVHSGRPLLELHQWRTMRRTISEYTALIGNANLALLLSAVIAIVTLVRQRHLTLGALAHGVESALMSAGIIILITASGGAFGQMLKEAQVGHAIETIFGGMVGGSATGYIYLTVGFLLAALLKVAQGSSTVAMIVGSGMISAIVVPNSLPFHPVYLATAIGSGSLIGSWMNDSGFWVYAKMGGLTETESLKSWTTLLIVLGVTSWLTTFALAAALPLK